MVFGIYPASPIRTRLPRARALAFASLAVAFPAYLARNRKNDVFVRAPFLLLKQAQAAL
jgi:hypothetical protein